MLLERDFSVSLWNRWVRVQLLGQRALAGGFARPPCRPPWIWGLRILLLPRSTKRGRVKKRAEEMSWSLVLILILAEIIKRALIVLELDDREKITGEGGGYRTGRSLRIV